MLPSERLRLNASKSESLPVRGDAAGVPPEGGPRQRLAASRYRGGPGRSRRLRRRSPKPAAGSSARNPIRRVERDARSLADDLGMDRGVVPSRAAASLRSAETKPFDPRDLSAPQTGESFGRPGPGPGPGERDGETERESSVRRPSPNTDRGRNRDAVASVLCAHSSLTERFGRRSGGARAERGPRDESAARPAKSGRAGPAGDGREETGGGRPGSVAADTEERALGGWREAAVLRRAGPHGGQRGWAAVLRRAGPHDGQRGPAPNRSTAS